MNEQRVSIPLNPNSDSSRPIKAGALAIFKAVRWIGREGAKTPDRMARIKQDVADGWKESGQC